jgi:anti-sigma factor RsiW
MVEERPQKCERARAWISAELDGELSEFESVLLSSHVGRCDSCSTFRADAGTFSAALRRAPHEPMSQPVSVSHRRRIAFQPLRIPAVAALAISMIAVGGLFESLHSGALFPQATRSSVAAFDDQDLHQLQLLKGPAALAQLRIRRAEVRPAFSRHTGFQNP